MRVIKQIKLFKDCCGTDLEDEVNSFCEKKHNVIDIKISRDEHNLGDTVIMVIYEVYVENE